jgi:Uma2 family endonuclease
MMTTQTKLITYDDYRTLPDNGKRYEIIGGELFMSPGATDKHQLVSHLLEYELENCMQQHRSGLIYDAPFDIVFSMTDVVQPDIFYISNERTHIITENNIIEAPDLVVEILSESTKVRDQTTKKTLYEKYGVKEYWLVYPVEEKVEQFILQDEAFELKDELQAPQKIISNVMDGCCVSLEKIFAI